MWDTRYRPLRFTDVLGQEGAVTILKKRLEKGTALDTSYIFGGGHGMGKTTLGRILGRALLCQNLTADAEPCNECENCQDALNETSVALSEMDAASRGTIEHAREIVETLSFVVAGAPKRVYIFDEAHRMSRDAQDVFLKPLEDSRMIGIFCTTEPEKIRTPIRSRCETYLIRKITREDILKRMKWILEQEKVEYEEDGVLTLIDYAKGHVRDTINSLEMLAQLGPVTLEAVRSYLNLSVVTTYYKILLALGTPAVAIELAEEACDRVGPEGVAEGIAEAAMNTYRLAHKMYAEYVLMDRELSQKVFEVYGDNVLKLSEFFLRSYHVSRVGLMNDILSCSSGIPIQAAPVVAPVLIQAQAPAQVVQTSEQISKTAVVEPVGSARPSVPAVSPIEKPDTTNGVDVGDPDPRTLTKIDHLGIPNGYPRGQEIKKNVVKPPISKENFLTNSEWRQSFALLRATLGDRG